MPPHGLVDDAVRSCGGAAGHVAGRDRSFDAVDGAFELEQRTCIRHDTDGERAASGFR